jgi:hypothetical protein
VIGSTVAHYRIIDLVEGGGIAVVRRAEGNGRCRASTWRSCSPSPLLLTDIRLR